MIDSLRLRQVALILCQHTTTVGLVFVLAFTCLPQVVKLFVEAVLRVGTIRLILRYLPPRLRWRFLIAFAEGILSHASLLLRLQIKSKFTNLIHNLRSVIHRKLP